ncbi:MAG TPA: DUF2239 family protein [Xanthobacteraceae bacterium]|nr:DUF2239 family protein [Xanthobacteraceae bacterium]
MPDLNQTFCTAFEGTRRIASGELGQVARKTKDVVDRNGRAPVLIFDDSTSEQIEVDFRGSAEDVAARLAALSGKETAAAAPRGPGRPKLGVVAREITLLPRHWEWLNRQPGGASVALRKLIDEARNSHQDRDRVRQAQEAAYRFMSAMAGNEPGFEEATRALFAKDLQRLRALTAAWPDDIRDHAMKLAGPALERAAE